MSTNRASVLVRRVFLLKKSCFLLPNYSLHRHHYHVHIPRSHRSPHPPFFLYNTSRVWIDFSVPITPDCCDPKNLSVVGHQQPDDDANAKTTKALKALSKLKQKQGNSAFFDLPTYHFLIQVCGQLRIPEYGRIIHDQLVRSKHIIQTTTYNQILDMYSHCGSISDAYDVFQNMPIRDFNSWDTMITGLAKNGLAEEAILLFTRFKEEGLQPDGQVFLGVFLACGVLGDVIEGMLHFESMNKVYGVVPSMEHYASVVNMFGSAGYLDEAMEFIEKMPFEPHIAIWETLMIFCRAHGNIELGNHCAEIVNHLDPCRLRDKSKEHLVPVEAFDKMTRKVKVRHGLVTCTDGEALLPVNHKVYTLMRGMNAHMKELGYVAKTWKADYYIPDLSKEEIEEVLLGHSEKIALAVGLMNTSCRTRIRIFKERCMFEGNVCEDCQNAVEIVSKLSGRDIMVVQNSLYPM